MPEVKSRVQRCDDAGQVAGRYHSEQLITENQATVDPWIDHLAEVTHMQLWAAFIFVMWRTC